MSAPDRIVFDTEPLVAYADDEPGSGEVADYLDAVAHGDSAGSVNLVNVTEVRYVLGRKYDREVADTFLEWLWSIGISDVGVEEVWERAADYIVDYNPALGDAYALGTAAATDATLIVGGDSDYDDIVEVEIRRFRDHGV